jgi:hypothetical protein
MFDRILLENEDLLLSCSLLGRYKIYLKSRKFSHKASKSEGLHFLRTIECMSDLGIKIEPGNEKYEFMAQDFCFAVLGAGDANWKVYFNYPPHELAQRYSLDG